MINFGGSITSETFSCQIDGIQQQVLSHETGIQCRDTATLSPTEHTLSISLETNSEAVSFDGLHYIPVTQQTYQTRKPSDRDTESKGLKIKGIRRGDIINNNNIFSDSPSTITIIVTRTLSPPSGLTATPTLSNPSVSFPTASMSANAAHISAGAISAIVLSAIAALVIAFWLGRRTVRKHEAINRHRDSASLVSPFTAPNTRQINSFPLDQYTTREKSKRCRLGFSSQVIAISTEETSRSARDRVRGDTGLDGPSLQDSRATTNVTSLPPSYMTAASCL